MIEQTPKDVMTVADVDRATRRALTIFDNWHRATGHVPEYCRSEVEACIEDAVHCGIQAAMGLYHLLDSEKD